MTTASPAPSQSPYPLAHDAEGNPLTIPAEAVAWRVRRGGGRRGRPRLVFDPETGLQLDIPLTATIDELIDRGCGADGYRPEAIGPEGRVLPGDTAVVEVPRSDEEQEAEQQRQLQQTVEGETVGALARSHLAAGFSE